MKQTPNYNLPQFEGLDKFTKEDFNDAFSKIDLGISDMQETINNASGNSIIVTQEIIEARKGETSLPKKIEKIDENIDTTNSQIKKIEEDISSQKIRIETASKFVNANIIENRMINKEYTSVQGGCYHNGTLYYFLVNNTMNIQKLVCYDVSNKVITREKDYSGLGHCSDCTVYNGKLLLTSLTSGIIYEIDLATLEKVNKTLSGVGVCQGIVAKEDVLYIKENDNLTIKLYNMLTNSVIKSFKLQIPDGVAIYKQGIDVYQDYLIDVRGVPASGYFYNISNGEFITSIRFDIADSVQPIGENEFISNDGNGNFYFGSFGSYNEKLILTNGFFNIKKDYAKTSPFISNNFSGTSNVYVNSQSTESIEDGTLQYPFKVIERGLMLLGKNNIKKLIITGGTYSDVLIQHKGTVELHFTNNATINNLNIQYSDVTLNNAVLTGKLDITSSDLKLNGSFSCDSGDDYCINAINSNLILVPNTTDLKTTKNQNIYVNKCSVICRTTFKIEGINYSIITNNLEQSVYNHKLDTTCLWNGKTIMGIAPLYAGTSTLTNTPPYTEIQVRARSGEYSTNMVVTQLSSATSSRKNVINFYLEISSTPYLASICFTYSENVITINYNKLINLKDGTIENYSTGTGNFAYIDQISFSR